MCCAEAIFVDNADAARIDDFEKAILIFHEVFDTIAGDTGAIFDNGDAQARKPIQHAALAHIGAANDDHTGNCHFDCLKMPCTVQVSISVCKSFIIVEQAPLSHARNPRDPSAARHEIRINLCGRSPWAQINLTAAAAAPRFLRLQNREWSQYS